MLKVRLEKKYFKVEDKDKDYEDIFSGDIGLSLFKLTLILSMITFDTKYISVEVVNITAPGAFIFKSVSSAR
jgi:hypothetical protein